jgi:hypothetical protein
LNTNYQGAQQRHEPLGAFRTVHLIVRVHPGLYHRALGSVRWSDGFAWVRGAH